MTSDPEVAPGVDPSVPSPARIYDYILGGSFNFPADRAVADRAMAQVPEVRDIIKTHRGFHVRAARFIAGQGLRQFLDIGSGLPAKDNTHDTVRAVVPGARVVYVDIDPMVAACAGQLLSDPDITRVVIADARDPDYLLGHPDVRGLLDLSQPVGMLLSGVLHFIADSDDPFALTARYVSELAPGSYVAMTHATHDNMPPRSVQAGRGTYESASEQMYFRSRPQVERFFRGLELVSPSEGAAPALSFIGEWHAEDGVIADSPGSRWAYCGVGRKA